jgi:hypothetical protein
MPDLGVPSITNTLTISVPNVETGYCLGSEVNGVSVGEGGQGRAQPSRKGE